MEDVDESFITNPDLLVMRVAGDNIQQLCASMAADFEHEK